MITINHNSYKIFRFFSDYISFRDNLLNSLAKLQLHLSEYKNFLYLIKMLMMVINLFNKREIDVSTKNLDKYKKNINKIDFHSFNQNMAITKLKQMFIIIAFFCYLEQKYYNQIEIHNFDNTINKVFDQLTLDNLL